MDHRETKQRASVPTALKWVVAPIAGVITGMATAVRNTHDEFRDKLLEYWRDDGLDKDGNAIASEVSDREKLRKIDIKGTLSQEVEAHKDELKRLTTERANGKISVWDYIKKSHEQKDAFNKKFSAFSEEFLGIEDSLLKGTWQRFNYMGANTKKGLVFNTIIGTTVGIAGTLMFFNGLSTHDKLSQILNNQNAEKKR